MSKLETNQVDPATGTTLTLGTSGDTIAIPSGVTIANSGTQTGFGGTNTPYFRAHQTTSQSVSNTTQTIVNFNTEDFDTDNNFASNRFTPTTAGKYYLSWSVGADMNSTANTAQATLFKNGSSELARARRTFYVGGTVQNFHSSCIVTANGSSDYFEIKFWHNQGGTITTQNEAVDTFFQGYKIIE